MTKHTCDNCGKETQSPGVSKLPEIQFDIGTPDKPMPCSTARYEPLSSGGFGSWVPDAPQFICRFNKSGFSVCPECVLKAFKKAVSELT